MNFFITISNLNMVTNQDYYSQILTAWILTDTDKLELQTFMTILVKINKFLIGVTFLFSQNISMIQTH